MIENNKAQILFSIIDEILRMQNCFENLFVDVQSLSHLTTLQKLVLFAILEAQVPPTVPQIGRNLGHTRQTVQRIVNDLEKEGLVEKKDNPHHRKASLLIATDQALSLKRLAERRAIESATAFLGTVNAQRCEALTGELRDLRKALEEYTQVEENTSSGDASSPVIRALPFI